MMADDIEAELFLSRSECCGGGGNSSKEQGNEESHQEITLLMESPWHTAGGNPRHSRAQMGTAWHRGHLETRD